MIYFLIGPSSSGKDYFFKYIKDKYNLNSIILHTTRPIRTGEVDGVTYHFLTTNDFDQLDQNHEFVERRDYDTKYGIWSYATHKDSIDKSKDYITINTWEGYKKFLDYLGKEQLFPIYFNVEPVIRLERAIAREKREQNPKYDELCRRFLADCKDFSQELVNQYKPYIIDNNGTETETIMQIDQLFLTKKIGTK